MIDRENIKNAVVDALDTLSPLDLGKMSDSEVEKVKLNFTSGFDGSMKKALCVPLSKIARKHGNTDSRIISQTETTALKTIKGAIDLTAAAAAGLTFDGE